jgi:hypothetical protein
MMDERDDTDGYKVFKMVLRTGPLQDQCGVLMGSGAGCG